MARSDALVDAGYVQAHGGDPGVVLAGSQSRRTPDR
jgi:hypothetical protein